MDKFKRFKLNIMKAFQEEEERKLQRSVWNALIEDEVTPEEPVTLVSRDVTSASQIAAAPAAQLSAGQSAAPEEPPVEAVAPVAPVKPEEPATSDSPATANPPPPPKEALNASIPAFAESPKESQN